MMFTALLVLALLFFVAHVALLFTSFSKNTFNKRRYAWSHYTLWLCGIVAYLAVILFAPNDGTSDVFNTPVKQGLILLTVIALSAVAHTIVRLLVLPRYTAAGK